MAFFLQLTIYMYLRSLTRIVFLYMAFMLYSEHILSRALLLGTKQLISLRHKSFSSNSSCSQFTDPHFMITTVPSLKGDNGADGLREVSSLMEDSDISVEERRQVPAAADLMNNE